MGCSVVVAWVVQYQQLYEAAESLSANSIVAKLTRGQVSTVMSSSIVHLLKLQIQLLSTVHLSGAALIDCTGAEIGQGYPNTVRLAQRLPVVCAPNLSYSHHLQLEAVRLVSESIEGALAHGLVNKPSVSVRDRHPIWKSTAPSATAVRLVAAVGEGNAELDTSITVSRRGGPVADHGFDVDWDYESLRITQTVESLEVSARTAVWLTKHVPHLCAGIYQLTDLLAELRFEF